MTFCEHSIVLSPKGGHVWINGRRFFTYTFALGSEDPMPAIVDVIRRLARGESHTAIQLARATATRIKHALGLEIHHGGDRCSRSIRAQRLLVSRALAKGLSTLDISERYGVRRRYVRDRRSIERKQSNA